VFLLDLVEKSRCLSAAVFDKRSLETYTPHSWIATQQGALQTTVAMRFRDVLENAPAPNRNHAGSASEIAHRIYSLTLPLRTILASAEYKKPGRAKIICLTKKWGWHKRGTKKGPVSAGWQRVASRASQGL
jgi:hypothetical protein